MVSKRIIIDETNNVCLDCYLHENPPVAFKEELARPAVVVCPGGGYNHLSEREADPVAFEYFAKGYNTFVLYYSLKEAATFPKPIVDLSKALKIIRENADEWHIIKDKIAVCGFSAGGHLCASLGVHWNLPEVMEKSDCFYGENKPNALILVYPAITTRGWLNEKHQRFTDEYHSLEDVKKLLDCSLHVGKHTPPTFLTHCFSDNVVPVQESLAFANVLEENDIPFELHVFPNGLHGMGLGNLETYRFEDKSYAKWMELSVLWLDRLFSDELFEPQKSYPDIPRARFLV